MIVLKTKRRRNKLISYGRTAAFRDDVIIFGSRNSVAFLTTFNNAYVTYEIITNAVPNGTYKIKVISVDDLENQSGGAETTVSVDFYPLPPKNVTMTVSGNNVTLTWQHSADGAPDNYLIYGNDGSGDVDETTILHTLAGNVLTHTFAVADGDWKFVVEAKKNGKQSDTLETVFGTVPFSNTVPPNPGIPGDVSALVLNNVSVGKVNIRFYWPYGSQAASFNVYHDDGTGTIDYGTPKFNFVRINKLIQTYTTTQLHFDDENKTYKFAIKALATNGKESTAEDEYQIEVDGVAPNDVISLSADSVF